MPDQTVLLPYQPTTMSTAQLAAVSYLARFAGHTHHLYAYQLNRWFASGSSRSPRPSPSIAAPSPTCWSCVSWKLAAASAPPGGWSCARAPVGRSTDRRDAHRMVARIAKAAGIPAAHQSSLAAPRRDHYALDAGVPFRDGVHFLTAYVAGV